MLAAAGTQTMASGRCRLLVADNIVPLIGIEDPTTLADPAQSMFDLVAVLRGEPPEWKIVRPAAVLADAELLRQFELDAPTAVLQLDLLGLGASGAHLYRSLEYHRSRDHRSAGGDQHARGQAERRYRRILGELVEHTTDPSAPAR